MCYKGNIFYCVPVQTVCLLLAIINVILNIILTVAGMLFWVFVYLLVNAINGQTTVTPNVTDSDATTVTEAATVTDATTVTFATIVTEAINVTNVVDVTEAPDVHYSSRWTIGFAVIFIILPLIAFVNMLFSSLLCHGICAHRPKLVKTYFWYGVSTTMAIVILSILLICFDVDKYNPEKTLQAYLESSDMASLGLYLLLGCLYHSLFLVLVQFTHKELAEKSIFNDHVRLVETPDYDRTLLGLYYE